MSAVLAVEGLHVVLRGRRRRPDQLILRGIDLRVDAGEVHALVGESGAGKSMVGRTVLGINPPGVEVAAGRIAFMGRDWLGLPEATRRSHLGGDIALVPQDPLTALNPAYTIGGQVNDLLRLHLKLGEREATERAVEMLEAVQIRDPRSVIRRYPHELSGGMRQRVLIAMAFACEPKLIIADEPTTALDVTVQREVLRLLRGLQRQQGVAVLFITHNLGIVAKLCDRVSVIHSGRIVEAGTARAIIEAPRTDYTRALFAATPRFDRPAETLQPIEPAVVDTLWAQSRAYDAEWLARRGAVA
jgi:peptide/nickel transport system ATP-binding protein